MPNGSLEVPLTRGDRLSQLGWYLEILDGATVIYERDSISLMTMYGRRLSVLLKGSN